MISWTRTVFIDCSYITGYLAVTASTSTGCGICFRMSFAVSSITWCSTSSRRKTLGLSSPSTTDVNRTEEGKTKIKLQTLKCAGNVIGTDLAMYEFGVKIHMYGASVWAETQDLFLGWGVPPIFPPLFAPPFKRLGGTGSAFVSQAGLGRALSLCAFLCHPKWITGRKLWRFQ